MIIFLHAALFVVLSQLIHRVSIYSVVLSSSASLYAIVRQPFQWHAALAQFSSVEHVPSVMFVTHAVLGLRIEFTHF